MNRHLWLIGSIALVGAGTGPAPAAPLKPGPPDVVTVDTRDLKLEFAGDRAWTIQRIFHKGELVCDKIGFYGTVFAEEGGKWIGTGHNDGGIEQVASVELIVDGKSCALADKAVYQGHRAEIHKKSMIGPLKLEASYVVLDDCLLERHRYEVTKDVKIGTLYAFMHPWLPRTTEWMAEKIDSSLIEGAFDNSGDFKLKDDPKWTAIYDPQDHRAMLCWYPSPLPGQGIKTGYWDKTVYHKLYNQLYAHAEVTSGDKFEAAVVVRGVEANPADWKSAAKSLADETAERFKNGDIHF